MSGRWIQLYTAISCSTGCFLMGFLNVWPSYTSVMLKSPATPLSAPMSKSQVAMLGSLPSLGAMAGTAVVSSLIDRIGRRRGGIALYLPLVMSWTIIAVSRSSILIQIARFLGGFSGGSALVYTTIFVSETADTSMKGPLATMTLALYGIGCLVSYMAGWFLSYKMITWLNIAASVGMLLLVAVTVESPVFLLRQKRDEDAKACLARYRGKLATSPEVVEEFSRMKKDIMPVVELHSVTECEKLNTENVESTELLKASVFKQFTQRPTSRRAFFVVFTVMTIQALMGIVPVQVYAKAVFEQADPSKADFYTVVFAIIMTVGSFVPAVLVEKTGRKCLIIVSSILVCVTMTVLGFLLQSHVAPPMTSVVLMLMFSFSHPLGAGSVPYILLAEFFVSEVQGLASMILVEWVWLLNFVTIAVFPYAISFIGIYGVFYVFAIFGLLNAIFCVLFLPETKGLNNAQIQGVLNQRKKN